MKLLIVTTMKPMMDPFIIEQTNAVLSWTKLRLNPTIIVFGDDQGVAEFCAEHQIQNIPIVKKNPQGVVYINEIIKEGYNHMDGYDYIMYINADILLTDDFSDTLEAFHQQYPDVKSCLLTAVRFDVPTFSLIDYNDPNWRHFVMETFKGKYSTPDGIDMFLHKKDNYANMPPFAVARAQFDSWMLDTGIKNFDMSVDMTKTVKIYHHFGKWYQGNKVVLRNWNLIERTSYNDNLRLYNQNRHSFNNITQCPYYSISTGDSIKFVKK